VAASIRVITINFFGLEPQVKDRIALAERQLRALAPDVVLMQEVRPLAPGGPTTADRLADALAMERSHARCWADDERGDEDGLAILSRHPLAGRRVHRLPDERPREARVLLSARVEHPEAPLWCHTTHLHWRPDDGLARERQVLAVDQAVKAAGAGDALHIVGGDLNATPDSDEIRFLRGLATLSGRRTFYQDAWDHAGDGAGPGHTWSLENPFQGPHRRLDWNRRIDYLLVTPRDRDGRGRILEARVVLDELSGDGLPCSDHYGVLAEVQIAPGAPS
jgi:endonuclease/exonuclease/phosphatase family metal-dependent hydrolase